MKLRGKRRLWEHEYSRVSGLEYFDADRSNVDGFGLSCLNYGLEQLQERKRHLN